MATGSSRAALKWRIRGGLTEGVVFNIRKECCCQSLRKLTPGRGLAGAQRAHTNERVRF
jgi:hypothetical protein